MYSVEYHKTGHDTATAGPTIAVPRGAGVKDWAIQAIKTGAAGAMDVDLQGSLDGSTWFKIVDHSNTSGEITWTTGKPVAFFRFIVNSITAPDTIAIYIYGVP